MNFDDMYSRRKQLASGKQSDVYQYDVVPDPMRVRIVQFAAASLGGYFDALPVTRQPSRGYWDKISKNLRQARGLLSLCKFPQNSADEVLEYIMLEQNTEFVLDAVEMVFRFIRHEALQTQNWPHYDEERSPITAIHHLNYWLRREQIGYQFEKGQIVRIDSQYAHAEVVKPALQVLTDPRFKGPNNEFLEAHEHYRHGRHKECLVSCLRSFESTMKVICEIRGWQTDLNATASKLITTCLANGLLPKFSEQQLTSVRTALESGVPTVRNKLGGHGQGSEVVDVPPHFASYALHLTAANILLLVEAEKNLPR